MSDKTFQCITCERVVTLFYRSVNKKQCISCRMSTKPDYIEYLDRFKLKRVRVGLE